VAVFEENHVAGAEAGGKEAVDGSDRAAAGSDEQESFFEQRE
jgi:hypothetical protein